eukprot:CAMPEP_0195308080 /NCGR_PEP_ID=MMETSP0707-20130614/38043_1 /TAXON_ID=33640 /ORGANISM="Asterionellopsis glacialis, Strain CCMP134" /LENGTH=421 /DNA_ID=CAMNT_0040372339 /DNA_START=297 /DNA_END=1562 /DNA_ORIENTATION=+
MEIWLDVRSVCPADLERVHQANTVVTSEHDLPFSVPLDDTSSSRGSSIRTIVAKEDNAMLMDDNTHKIVGTVVDIADAAGQDKALAAVGSVEWILAMLDEPQDSTTSSSTSSSTSGWQMIPAENLIGAATNAGTKVAVSVKRVEDVVGLSRALELGVDALCVAADASTDLWEAVMEARTERANAHHKEQQPQHVTPQQLLEPQITVGSCWRLAASTIKDRVSSSPSSPPPPTVLADRVCLDLVRTLESTEGCWIGSSAKVMALVLSEAAVSSFVPSRPFRVNAGPFHSYVLLGDGITTKYLCELQAGEEVLVYDNATGLSRSVAVGRLKIEVRPCVIVGLKATTTTTAKDNDDDDDHDDVEPIADGQIFVQQAETVRLGKEEGQFVRVTDLGINQAESALLRITGTGTHVGKAYTGKVVEV